MEVTVGGSNARMSGRIAGGISTRVGAEAGETVQRHGRESPDRRLATQLISSATRRGRNSRWPCLDTRVGI